MRQVFLVSCALCALIGCKDSTASKHTVPASVHFVNGATPLGPTPALGGPNPAAGAPVPNAVPQNGIWFLSPDKLTMTAKHVYLDGDVDHSQADVDCTATYDRSKASLSALSDCSFQVTPGTYTSIQFDFDNNLLFTFNDAVNGFYSTASSIVTSPPAGGAVPMVVTIPNGAFTTFVWRTPFPSPLVITDTTSLSNVSVVLEASQKFGVTVSGGVVTPNAYAVGITTPIVVATVGTVGAFEIYGGPGITSTASLCYAGACNVVFNRLVVAYSSPTTPVAASLPIVHTTGCNGDVGGLFVANLKSYMGLDASGNLGWAQSGDKNTNPWNGYSALWRIARQTTLGSSTTLYCVTSTTDPNPPGGSFASGAPNIASAANAVGTYTLIAH